MKPLAFFLLAVISLSALPLAAAPDRYEKQEATAWVKEEMSRLKKTHALLKRVKDEKSAEKVGKALLAMYKVEREQTAMGETGPATRPTSEAMVEADEKNAARRAKLEGAIASQLRRIEALGLESSTLAEALSAMGSSIGAGLPALPGEASDADEP